MPPLLQLHIVLLSFFLSYVIVTTSGQENVSSSSAPIFNGKGSSLFFPFGKTSKDLVRCSICGFSYLFIFVIYISFCLFGAFWLPNRLVDHPSALPCAIEFNQFFFPFLPFSCKLGYTLSTMLWDVVSLSLVSFHVFFGLF